MKNPSKEFCLDILNSDHFNRLTLDDLEWAADLEFDKTDADSPEHLFRQVLRNAYEGMALKNKVDIAMKILSRFE